MADLAVPSLAASRIDRAVGVRRRGRRWWPWLLGAALLLAAAYAAFAPRRFEVSSTAVVSAFPSAQYAQLTASGYVVAQRRAAVASKATGRLLELLVREGSVLKKGDLIARLDANDVLAGLAASEAGVGQAEAAVRQAEAGVRQAEVQRTNADDDLRRTQGLVTQEFVSPQALDAARTRALAARAALNSAQAALGAARAGVTQARAQVRVQQVNRDNTEIRAPFDGVVLVKNANVGDMITPFSSAAGTLGAVVTMADLTTLEVEADVSESNVAKVRIDQPVEITLDAIADARFRGSVSRIVPTVDRAKATVTTKVRFETLDARILPEMSAKAIFLSQPASAADQKPVLAVNPKAIVERDGAKGVFRIAADMSAQWVAVKPARTLGDVVEVSGGDLKSGDKLVLAPAEALKPGAKLVLAAR